MSKPFMLLGCFFVWKLDEDSKTTDKNITTCLYLYKTLNSSRVTQLSLKKQKERTMQEKGAVKQCAKYRKSGTTK